MSKELRGTRSVKEASAVLTSVTVYAQRLDALGKTEDEGTFLGRLFVDKESGVVTLASPDGADFASPGYQLVVRERGRESRTLITKLWFEDDGVVPEPEPEPEPEPDPEPEPEPDPEPTAFPDATSTGSRGLLPKRDGFTVTTPGAVVENLDIAGTLTIKAANVTVRNCTIRAEFFGIDVDPAATGLTVEDCTIIGGGDSGIASTRTSDVTIRRCDISGGFDGMKIAGADVLVERNYIHDLASGPTAHNDGIQVYGSATRVRFIGNAIHARDTGGISMFVGKGFKYTDVDVVGNLLRGAGYPLYAGGKDATGMTVTGNTFGDWGWGPVSDWTAAGGNVWADNVDLDGAPINR